MPRLFAAPKPALRPLSITCTFEVGTDVNRAVIDTNNRVQIAEPDSRWEARLKIDGRTVELKKAYSAVRVAHQARGSAG